MIALFSPLVQWFTGRQQQQKHLDGQCCDTAARELRVGLPTCRRLFTLWTIALGLSLSSTAVTIQLATVPPGKTTATFGEEVDFVATVSGGTVAEVYFSMNGEYDWFPDISAPYTTSYLLWNDGEYTFQARAKDAWGTIVATSNTITIRVGDPQVVTLDLTATPSTNVYPGTGVTLTATPSTTGVVSTVRFYKDDDNDGVADPTEWEYTDGTTPYTYGFTAGLEGTYRYIAVGDDLFGTKVCTSPPLSVIVSENPVVDTPTFDPAPGAYTGELYVTVACSTKGATIRYTTDGSDPTATSPVYHGLLHVKNTTQVKARAFKAGLTASLVRSGVYTITPPPSVATPMMTPPSGSTFTTSSAVLLQCTTPGATIHYSVDGTDPTEASPCYTDGIPIVIAQSTVVKARAFATEKLPSQVAVATYTVNIPVTSSNLLTYQIVDVPTHGTLTGVAPNLLYTPAPNFFGTDRFTYRGSDGIASSNTATMTINVAGVNDAPVAANQRVVVPATDPAKPIKLRLGAVDPDGDTLTYIIVSPPDPQKGTLTGSGADRTLTPTTMGVETISFTFKVRDSHNVESNTATVTVALPGAPGNITTTYEYAENDPNYPFGKLIKVQVGDRTPTTYSDYDAFGHARCVTSPKPDTVAAPGASTFETVETRATYDAYGNVLTATSTGRTLTETVTTTSSYTDETHPTPAIGQPLAVTDALGHTTRFRYDQLGNVIASIDELGNETNYTYNIVGQVVETLLPATGQTGTGRGKTVNEYVYPGGPLRSTTTYDEHVNALGQHDHIVSQVISQYGPAGELRSQSTLVTPANGATPAVYQTISYTYDALYRKDTISDGEGHTTADVYDKAGNLLTETYPDGKCITYSDFDNVGRARQRTDANNNIVYYTYNGPGGTLSRVWYARDERAVEYTYDRYWRKAVMEEKQGVAGDLVARTTYAYDDLDTVLSTTTTFSGIAGEKTIAYSHYPQGARQTMTTPGGTFYYAYDKLGQPTGLLNPQNRWTTWSHRADGALLWQRAGNGALTSYAINPLGQLTRLAQQLSTGTALQTYDAITYDGNGNCTGFTVDGRPTTYQYDLAGQLRQENTTPYAYDLVGNATTFGGTTYTYNANNQITPVTGQWEYDGNGNPTRYQGQRLSFDQADRLTCYATAGNTVVLRAAYNGDGVRAWREVGGTRTYFLYDGATLVCELNSTGAVIASNTFGPTGLLSRYDSRGETFYLFDLFGNVAQRLASNGTTVRSADRYDAWGNLLEGGDSQDPYGYQGQAGYYTDHATGLILCTHRYYDPEMGRWVTRDPIGYEGGVNLYGYCGGDPVNGVDSNGTDFTIGPKDSPWLVFTLDDTLEGLKVGASAVGSAFSFDLWDGGLQKMTRHLKRANYLLSLHEKH